MAIQVRRGLQKDFKPDKMLPGEMAVTTDTRRIYAAFAPGDCKRMATYEDMQSDIKDATAEIVEELTTEANAATAKANTAAAAANTATTKASTAASAANTATSNANAATSAANTAKANAEKATTAANTAATNANTAKANAEKATTAANTAATNANTAKANAEKATTAANTAATSATEAAQEARDAAEQALSKGVTGVKGSAETSYRSGQVELTPANLGIVAATASASGLMSASDKSKLDGIAAGANKTTIDASLSSTSSNPVQNKAVNSALSGKLGTSGDAKDVTVTYTSNDSTTAPDATPPVVMTSGEKLSSLFSKLSTFGKNVRWLLSRMGSTDISTIGDGTVTGAISALNSNLTFEYTYVPPNRQELGTIYTLSLIKVGRIVTASATFIPSTDISYSSDQAPLFILPEGYRPYISHSANAPNVLGLSPLVLMIRENGNIDMQNISGPIKSGMYTTFQACWICA